MERKRQITVSYINKRGAHVTKHFQGLGAVEAFISKLHCEAEIRDGYRRIGSVSFAPGVADDRRIKWQWFLEAD